MSTLRASISGVLLAAGSTEPVGPSGWSARSWLGLLLYLGLFALALWGISRLGAEEDREAS